MSGTKLERPLYVPEHGEPGRQPRGMFRWNFDSHEWEYWADNNKEFVISDFGLDMIRREFHEGEKTNRVELVIGTHGGQLVLRSVPVKRLREVIKEELGYDIG